METEITYRQIYKALFSPEIESYVPDGAAISHPAISFLNGRIVDCFLLYTVSLDQSRCSVPAARIRIDSERKQLAEYKTVREQPFSVYKGTDYGPAEAPPPDEAEQEYQTAYMAVRKIAFRDQLTPDEKKQVIRYIQLVKIVVPVFLQPYFFELALPFFQWVRKVLS